MYLFAVSPCPFDMPCTTLNHTDVAERLLEGTNSVYSHNQGTRFLSPHSISPS